MEALTVEMLILTLGFHLDFYIPARKWTNRCYRQLYITADSKFMWENCSRQW